MENHTFESITQSMRELASRKEVVSPEIWMRGAVRLNILLEAEVEKLIEFEFNLAKMRKDLMAVNDKVSAVKMMVEASEEYKQARLQKAKIDNARESILMAKKYATLASDQMRSGL